MQNSKIIYNYQTIQYSIQGKTPQEMCTKLNWTFEEEQFLREVVETNKNLTWNEIAVQINQEFPQKCRTGKQYRERYVNYVQFQSNSVKNSAWSPEEEFQLFRIYGQIGTKWTIIAKIIPTKSENSLKNKFYGALRKALRKINRIGKETIKKFNKFIRYESLIRVMDAAEGGQDLPTEIKMSSIEIKREILTMAKNCEKQFDVGIVSQIIKKIHKFNIATRCYSSKKWKRTSNSSASPNSNELSSEQSSIEQKSQKSNVSSGKALKQSWRTQNEPSQKQDYKIKNQQQIQEGDQKQKLVVAEENINQPKKQPTCSDDYQAGAIEITQIKQEEFESSGKQAQNDLEFELCGILKENYVPQFFNYFES